MKVIKERLIESVEDETGIKLTAKDLKITADSGKLKITLWDTDLLTLSYKDGDLENDDFAEEVIDELYGEHYDLKGKIVELKLDDLNDRILPDLTEKILDVLEDNKIDQNLLDTLDFEFIDMGYIQGNFSTPGDEELDYPQIALRVSDFEELEFHLTVDPYKDPSTYDPTSLSKEIVKKIRGK